MTSQSESEGEIIETEHEKAISAQPSTKNADIDPRGRHETPASNSSSLSGRFDRYRSRSRSPYRAKSPRGEKRRRHDAYGHERDHRDSRRFKVHYEDSRSYDDRRQRVSYADIDRDEPTSYGSDRESSPHLRKRRSRTRSRSPFRHDKPEPSKRHDTQHRSNKSSRRDRDRMKYDNRSNRQSADTRRSETAQASPRDRDVGHAQATSSRNGGKSVEERAPAQPLESAPEVEVEEAPAAVDEAALIEERRKRREAIKAKFKGSATPLLVQALQPGGESAVSTPITGSPSSRTNRSASPMPSAPTTPKIDSAPDSPAEFTVMNGEDLANHHEASNGEDDFAGPSAADYDPTMDMQEDRAREGQRHYGDESSAAYDETKAEHRDILLPADEVTSKAPPAAKRKELDMFADEEDDDMFAESPPNKAGVVAGSKAVPIPQALPELDLDLRDNWDDQDGYYRFNPRDALDGRYHPQTSLGRGMFSAVFRATDIQTDKFVAIKIIRNNETMRKAGYKEIEILKKLASTDPKDEKHIIRLFTTFDHRGHLCMVFENLNLNLREVLKKFGRDVGLNLKAVRTYAKQIFLGLGLLKKCNILHADLKPDNILVNEPLDTLKICDLGSAGDASENEITPYLVSRFYRAPEIILGMEYSFPIDMWSIGCTLFELYTGKILFTGRSNNQMLKAIMECRGKFPPKMLNKGELRFEHFDYNLETFKSREKDKITGKEVTRMISINKPIRDLKSRVLASSKGLIGADMSEINQFIDLLERCLQLRPEQRITPRDALEHRFFKRSKP